jgi:hypothetical protein
MSTSEVPPEALDLAVWLTFNEAYYRIPMKCVIELLVTHADVFETRIYRVQSGVSVPAFEAFWRWLFTGRERSVPEIHMAECSRLGREFAIPTLEAIDTGRGPCMEARILDLIEVQYSEILREFEDSVEKLEAEAKSASFVDSESPPGRQFVDVAQRTGPEDVAPPFVPTPSKEIPTGSSGPDS